MHPRRIAMDRLQAMQSFVRVAEAGSFSAVADQQGVARSVITRQIAALEAALGTKLIARSTRRLSLTAAGSAYREKCIEVLGLIEEAESGLVEERAAPSGPIPISVPLSFGIRHLMPMMMDFTTANPGIRLSIDFTDRRADLIEEGFDVAIRITGSLSDTQVARKIGVCRSVVVASPDYLKRHKRPRHPRDLADHECFGYVPTMRSSWPFVIDGKLNWVRTQGRIEANNGDALLDAAIRGLGIAYQPTFIAAPAIEAGLLKPILTSFPTADWDIYAVFPGQRYVPHRVRALVDHVGERIGAHPYWERR